MYIYIYIYIYIHRYTYTNVYICRYTHMHYMYVYIYIYIHNIHTCICICICIGGDGLMSGACETSMDATASLRGSSVTVGATQIILAYPLRKAATHRPKQV